MIVIGTAMVAVGLLLWVLAALVLMVAPDPSVKAIRIVITWLVFIGIGLITQGTYLMLIT